MISCLLFVILFSFISFSELPVLSIKISVLSDYVKTKCWDESFIKELVYVYIL